MTFSVGVALSRYRTDPFCFRRKEDEPWLRSRVGAYPSVSVIYLHFPPGLLKILVVGFAQNCLLIHRLYRQWSRGADL